VYRAAVRTHASRHRWVKQYLGIHPGRRSCGVVGVAVEGCVHHGVGAWAAGQRRCHNWCDPARRLVSQMV
jgi:hypothetical protein